MRIKLQFKKMCEKIVDIPNDLIKDLSKKELDKYIEENYYENFIKENAQVKYSETMEGILVQCNCINKKWCIGEECEHYSPHLYHKGCTQSTCIDDNIKEHHGVKCVPFIN